MENKSSVSVGHKLVNRFTHSKNFLHTTKTVHFDGYSTGANYAPLSETDQENRFNACDKI